MLDQRAAPGARGADLVEAIERWPRWWKLAVHVTVLAALVAGDYLTGAFVAFTALYLVPIAAAAWFSGRTAGVATALVATASWLFTDLATRRPALPAHVLAWNLVAQLVVFSLAALLVHALRRALVEERRALVAEHERRLSAQQQLRHAERLSTVGKLAAGVAHELGTPLNVVASYSQMMRAGGVSDVAKAAGIIHEQAASMTRIVRQLVDFARASRPQRVRTDVRPVIGATLAMLGALAGKKQVSLRLAEGPALPADIDVGQLQQVFTNLVVNAIHAVREQGRVDVEAHAGVAAPPAGVEGPARACVIVTVQDDGPGIPAEVLPNVFEPFVTTKEVGEGSGLGLAVAWGIVREHGGWISAENAREGGARFTVFLPAP